MDGPGPFFSIIIPTFNRAEMLREAISSVLSQEFQDWELLVVDDGSTDHTREVATAYCGGRVKYFRKVNEDVSVARNFGMDRARGRYFCFLDDDDLFTPDHLDLVHRAINETAHGFEVYRSGELLRRGKTDIPTRNYENDRDILQQYWEEPAGQFGMVYVTDPVSRLRFEPSQRLMEDFWWVNQVLKHYRMYQVDSHSAVVRFHEGRRTVTFLNDEHFRRNLQILRDAYHDPQINPRVLFDDYRRLVLHQYMHYARLLIRAGKRGKAFRLFREGKSYATFADRRELMTTFAKLLW